MRQANTEGYLTVWQIKEQVGHDEHWIQERLKQLRRENRLAIRKIGEANLAGRLAWKAAYLVLPRKGRDKRVVAGVGPLGGLDALRGRFGSALYGFRGYELNPDGMYYLRENPDEQAAIVRMKDWRNRGWTNVKIAKTLEAEGVPAARGLRWHGEVVGRILARSSAEQTRGKKEGKPRRRRGATS